MASRDLTLLEAGTRKRAEWFLEKCKKAGINVIITCTKRTPEEQNELYTIGRSGPNDKRKVVTWVKAWGSWHNVGRAFDICFTDGKLAIYDGELAKWDEVAVFAAEIGLTWGGNWNKKQKDRPHFQYEYDGTAGKKPLSYYVAKEKEAQAKATKAKTAPKPPKRSKADDAFDEMVLAMADAQIALEKSVKASTEYKRLKGAA